MTFLYALVIYRTLLIGGVVQPVEFSPSAATYVSEDTCKKAWKRARPMVPASWHGQCIVIENRGGI